MHSVSKPKEIPALRFQSVLYSFLISSLIGPDTLRCEASASKTQVKLYQENDVDSCFPR